jgi:HlyD family secretion protein
LPQQRMPRMMVTASPWTAFLGPLRGRASRIALVLLLAAVSAGALAHYAFRQKPSAAAAVPNNFDSEQVIVARGRIEPSGRVVAIAGPADGSIAVIRELLVDQGSKVEAGQVLAILEGYEARRASLEVARRNLELAELQRTQVQTGAKSADVAAQTDTLKAKRTVMQRLQKQWLRRSLLNEKGVISDDAMEVLRADLDQAVSEVGQAENALKSLTEVRGIDDQVAAARVEVQKAAIAQAEADMKRLQLRAPTSGTVLSLHARVGEAILADGVLRMADLTRLIVVADVDESKMPLVTEGMKAEIDGSVLGRRMAASVSRIAHEVYRQKRPASDVLVGRDARIVEIELTPQQPLPPVLGGEVIVRLYPAQKERR